MKGTDEERVGLCGIVVEGGEWEDGREVVGKEVGRETEDKETRGSGRWKSEGNAREVRIGKYGWIHAHPLIYIIKLHGLLNIESNIQPSTC